MNQTHTEAAQHPINECGDPKPPMANCEFRIWSGYSYRATARQCKRVAKVKLVIAPRGTVSPERVTELRCSQHAEQGSAAMSGVIVTNRSPVDAMARNG